MALPAERRNAARAGAEDDIPDNCTKDKSGNAVQKWVVDYAAREGRARATCRDLDCLERHDQGGSKLIEKGALRIGRRVLIEQGEHKMAPGDEGEPKMMVLWHHARCIFNTFLRARRNTRVIRSVDDLDGFSTIKLEDQNLLSRIIDGSEEIRGAHFAANLDTPEKVGTSRKRPRLEEEMENKMKKGERVWAHFRTRGKDKPGGPGPMAALISKSEKPELAMIVDGETKGGKILVQFESPAHLKERTELWNQPKFKRIQGWLRYPRQFEGPKQLVDIKWVDWMRATPRLCSCNRKEWGHECDCGITCGRGVQTAIYGVCQ